jgi:hypothetical protein
MNKFSSLTIAAAILASISAPALAQIAGPAPGSLDDPPLYNYAPAAPLFLWSPYSNHPAFTGGGSYGYNVDVLKNQGY